MFELLEKTVLTGLGLVSLSQKKAEELLDELKQKYRVSEEEGKAFLEKLQRMAKESRDSMGEVAEAEVRKAIHRTGMVSRVEFDRLQQRVDELENLVKDTQTAKVYPVP
jgi:polyhydroxyalkanoate synthesis regulator phasin